MSRVQVEKLDGWVTMSEVAKALGVERQSANKMVETGKFPSVRGLGERPILVVSTEDLARVKAERESRGSGE